MVYSAKSAAVGTISQFTRRKDIKITTGGTSTPANYQTKVTIAYEPGMQTTFADIRFNTKAGTYIDYWIESKTDSDTAVVWLELPDAITHPGTDTVWMYYGNAGLSDGGVGDDTFEFFDNFGDFWDKDATNPVIAHSTGVNDKDNYQLYDGRLIDDGDNYRMYYTANKDGVNKDHIFTAISVKSNDFKNWTKYTESGNVTPVVAIGGAGTWDKDNVYGQTVIKESSSSYKMWYLGDDASVSPHFLRIGYATSSDGVSWTKYGSNPIYTNTSVSANGIGYFIVWKDDDTHYYAAMGHYQIDRVDILQSSDGLSWSALTSNAIADIQPNELKKIDGVYYIYGTSKTDYTKSKCYSATSISGSWTDRGVQLTAIGSGWEQRCYHPTLFEISTGNYLLSYSGWDGSIRPEIGISTLTNSVPYVNEELDLTKWEGTTSTASISEGILTVAAATGNGIHSIAKWDRNVAFRGKVKRDSAATTMLGFIGGWGTDGAMFRYDGSGDMLITYGGGSYTLVSGTTSLSTYKIVDITWLTDEAKFFVDGAEETNSPITTAVPTGLIPIGFHGTDSRSMYADWVFVHKYIANEPTSSIGTAQHQRRVSQFM